MLRPRRCAMAAVVGWVLILVVAGVLTAMSVRWLLPRDPEAARRSTAETVQRALDHAARSLSRGTESRLARVQRELYARAIEALPRSRAGALNLPGRIDAALAPGDA